MFLLCTSLKWPLNKFVVIVISKWNESEWWGFSATPNLLLDGCPFSDHIVTKVGRLGFGEFPIDIKLVAGKSLMPEEQVRVGFCDFMTKGWCTFNPEAAMIEFQKWSRRHAKRLHSGARVAELPVRPFGTVVDGNYIRVMISLYSSCE
jgi:hypothetical protein